MQVGDAVRLKRRSASCCNDVAYRSVRTPSVSRDGPTTGRRPPTSRSARCTVASVPSPSSPCSCPSPPAPRPRRRPPSSRPRRSPCGRTSHGPRHWSCWGSSTRPRPGSRSTSSAGTTRRSATSTPRPSTARTGPDVLVGAHDWLGQLVAAGTVLAVDLPDPAAFVPVAVEAMAYDHVTYGVPLSTENVALVRNDALASSTPPDFDGLVAQGEDLVRRGVAAVPRPAAADRGVERPVPPVPAADLVRCAGVRHQRGRLLLGPAGPRGRRRARVRGLPRGAGGQGRAQPGGHRGRRQGGVPGGSVAVHRHRPVEHGGVRGRGPADQRAPGAARRPAAVAAVRGSPGRLRQQREPARGRTPPTS